MPLENIDIPNIKNKTWLQKEAFPSFWMKTTSRVLREQYYDFWGRRKLGFRRAQYLDKEQQWRAFSRPPRPSRTSGKRSSSINSSSPPSSPPRPPMSPRPSVSSITVRSFLPLDQGFLPLPLSLWFLIGSFSPHWLVFSGVGRGSAGGLEAVATDVRTGVGKARDGRSEGDRALWSSSNSTQGCVFWGTGMAFEFWYSLKTSSLALHAVRSDKKMMRAASAVVIQLLVMLTSSIQVRSK